jgi:hypothetical protein
MTIRGGSDDATAEFPLIMSMRAQDDDASYRQDDAPPGAATPEPGGSEGWLAAAVPSRAIDEVIATLRSTPDEFARLIEGKSDEALAQAASDGEWGVVEILPHLRDWEEVYLGWIQQILSVDTPALPEVDDSLWAIEHDYANEPVPHALATFSDVREEVVGLLASLDPASWERRAIHPRAGRITLHQLADRMCDHDARHIEQARDALG